jgi:hypothetical protein
MAAPGSGIVFWVVMFLILLFTIRRFPKEEVFAFFGLTFGILILFGLGGAYYWAKIGQEVVAVFWLVIWLIGFLLIQKRLRSWLTPTFFLADEFAKVVGPIPVSRELPSGCIIVGLESILFFILLMVAGLLGPILWLFHYIIFIKLKKRHQQKPLKWPSIIFYIIINVFLLVVLYFVLKNIGADEFLRKIMGG